MLQSCGVRSRVFLFGHVRPFRGALLPNTVHASLPRVRNRRLVRLLCLGAIARGRKERDHQRKDTRSCKFAHIAKAHDDNARFHVVTRRNLSISSSDAAASRKFTEPLHDPGAQIKRRWHVYCDLDGVLADFDVGVRNILGRGPDEIYAEGGRAVGQMWGTLAAQKGFFSELPWMADGQQLWKFLAEEHDSGRISLSILTGTPRGRWASVQKKHWCATRLGANIPVEVCMKRDKPLRSSLGQILIDDAADQRVPWESKGGIFIWHTSAQTSVNDLQQVLSVQAPLS